MKVLEYHFNVSCSIMDSRIDYLLTVRQLQVPPLPRYQQPSEIFSFQVNSTYRDSTQLTILSTSNDGPKFSRIKVYMQGMWQAQ